MVFFRAGKKLKPVGSKSINVNGTHDVTNYETALVNVPGLVPTGTKEITTNGTHDVTNYASASVNVPVGVFPTGTKNITTNGTHDVTNYVSASVNVPNNITFDSFETYPAPDSGIAAAGSTPELSPGYYVILFKNGYEITTSYSYYFNPDAGSVLYDLFIKDDFFETNGMILFLVRVNIGGNSLHISNIISGRWYILKIKNV